MSFSRAIVRPPCKDFASGLTTAGLGRPSVGKAVRQHAAYVAELRRAGVEVVELPPDERFPDSTFVEDIAVVAGHSLIWTRPGAPSRQGEVEAMMLDLPTHVFPGEPVARRIEAPGTVEGGDVCKIDSRYLIGLSERTNEVGAAQLADLLELEGYAAEIVDVQKLGLLHLKTGLSYLGDGLAVVLPQIADLPALRGLRKVVPEHDEAFAANCIPLATSAVLLPKGAPGVVASLAAAGRHPIEVDLSEFRKMDGGASCLSIRIKSA